MEVDRSTLEFRKKQAISTIVANKELYPERKVFVVELNGSAESAVNAALCVEAIGKENVVGVLMPNVTAGLAGYKARELADILGIKLYEIPVTTAVAGISVELSCVLNGGVSPNVELNLPDQVRQITIRSFAESLGGVVINSKFYRNPDVWIGCDRDPIEMGKYLNIHEYLLT